MGPALGFLGHGLQPLSLLIQDGKLVDLTGSTEKDYSGKDLTIRVKEGEASKAIEESVSLPDNLVTFSSFLGMFVVGVEKGN